MKGLNRQRRPLYNWKASSSSFFLGVISGLSLKVFSFIHQDNLLKKTMVYWSQKRRENCACICWFRNWLHQNHAPCLISLFNKNTDVNANSITPVFYQHSYWRKVKVEFMAKTPGIVVSSPGPSCDVYSVWNNHVVWSETKYHYSWHVSKKVQ